MGEAGSANDHEPRHAERDEGADWQEADGDDEQDRRDELDPGVGAVKQTLALDVPVEIQGR